MFARAVGVGGKKGDGQYGRQCGDKKAATEDGGFHDRES
jgi:hypothetical protein